MDQISYNRIDTLHPIWREDVKKAYTEANNELGKRCRLRISYAIRTWLEQGALYAQGRESMANINAKRKLAGMPPLTSSAEAKRIVTSAKPGDSFHQYGLAFDIVILYDTDGNGTFEKPSWDTKMDFDKDGISDWLEVTRIFTKYGYQNGFIKNGKKWDLPHFQKTFGMEIPILRKRYENKEFIPGTTYVRL